MYSHLTLYYLNQIGITPWINKQDSLNNKSQMSDHIAPKIIIVKNNKLDNKAEGLFNRMVSYINLKEPDLLISETLSSSLVSDEQSPQAILLLGVDFEDLISELNLKCPVFTGVSPDVLLINPSEKRAVFQALHSIKALINPN
jgi:hypothetical protein